MLAWRVFIIGSVLLASGSLVVDKAQAQQGYEFGIRFQPINFRPTNFDRFSFSGYAFRPTSAQPIQFNRINFPAFNSRAVRQDFDRSRDRGRSNQSIVFWSGRDRTGRSDLRLRLSQHRGPASPTLSDRRRSESDSRLGVRHPLPEQTGRLARGESHRGAFFPASRIAGTGRLVGPSSRIALANVRRPFTAENRAGTATTRATGTIPRVTSHRARTAVSASSRTSRRQSRSTDVRSASRLRGDMFSSTAIRR